MSRVAQVLRGEWSEMIAREGNAPPSRAAPAADTDEPPCPACGHAAALVDGCCADCGLHLE